MLNQRQELSNSDIITDGAIRNPLKYSTVFYFAKMIKTLSFCGHSLLILQSCINVSSYCKTKKISTMIIGSFCEGQKIYLRRTLRTRRSAWSRASRTGQRCASTRWPSTCGPAPRRPTRWPRLRSAASTSPRPPPTTCARRASPTRLRSTSSWW